jgi:aspartate carbamoyltransferase regulatory subunit
MSELGNQYGINLSNILSTESAIKSARLNQKAKQLEIDKEEAGNALRKNYLDTSTNAQKAKEFKIGQEAGIEGPMEQPIETLPQEEVNSLSSIAPDATVSIQKQQKLQAMKQALKKMYIAKNESDDVSEYMSNMDIKDIVNFEKMYVEKDKITQANIRNGIAQQGRLIETVITTAQTRPTSRKPNVSKL